MTVLNISEELMDGIFALVSAVLQVGNLEFHDVDGESMSLTANDEATVKKISQLLKVLRRQLFGVDTP
jgi:myosin-7